MRPTPFYVQATPVFQIAPIDDQQWGGLIMWIPGQLLDLLILGVLFAIFGALWLFENFVTP